MTRIGFRTVAVAIGIWRLADPSVDAATRRPAAKSEVRVRLNGAEEEWIRAHPQVRWGFDPDWPPFSSFDSYHRLTGIDADLTRLVARRAGLRLTLVSGASWAEVYAKAKAGEVDFLSATARTSELMADFDYTGAYGAFPVVVVTRNEAPFLTMMPDLRSLSIAAARDDAVTGQLKHDLPTARLILTENAEKALKLVAHGGADATVQNLAVASRAIRLNGLTNLKISGVTHYEFPLRFAARKDAPELTSILNKGLETITSDELEAVYAAHLTPDIGKARDWGMWRRRALFAMGIGTALAGVLLLWHFGLKEQIRSREAAERQLNEARKVLERDRRELAMRVAEVERLNEEMRAANHELESFTISVSHDLRGPLRRMSSFAELLQKQVGVFLSRPHSEWLALVVRESKRMDLIIHDLLELARLGRRELRMQRIDMVTLAKSAIEDLQPQVHDRSILWKVGELGEIQGDPHLLRLVLADLLDNALKYTRQTAQAQITIDTVPHTPEKPEATIYVRDNGCGFDMKEAKKIFEPFERLPQGPDYEGIGIGLANVSKIIQKHGGKVWCESAPSQGATFFFTLPLPGGAEKASSEVEMESASVRHD